MTYKERVTALLNRLGAYTKTDMIYLAKGGSWITFGQAVSSFSVLIIALALANLLPPETYGSYKYILSVAGIFSLFTLPGMATAVTRAAARGEDSSIFAATRERILYSLAGAAIALCGAGYYEFIGNNHALALALLIVAATLPLFDTFTLYDSYLLGKRRFDLQVQYFTLTQLVTMPVLVATAYVTHDLIALLLAYFVPLIGVRYLLYRHVTSNLSSTTADPETLSYGKHLTLMAVLGTVAANADKILLFKFNGAIDTAVYTFAVAIPEQLKGPLKGVAELAFPKFAAKTPEEIRRDLPALKYKMLWYALGLIVASIAYVFIAPFIFHFLFPKYMASVFYSQVFMFSAVGLVGTIPLTVLAAHKKTREQYIFFTSQPILQIILYAVLIPLWGIMGAIMARMLMRILYTFQSLALLESSFKE
jgi:O-antigen/teichoic acid export membrane protein